MLAICSAPQRYVIFGHRARLRTWRLPLSMSYKNVGVMCRYNFMVTVTHTIEQTSRLPGHAFHELERRGRGATDFCCTKDNHLDRGIEGNGSLVTLILVANFAL
ncbi:hypothetical protein T07_6355, partial [Trichinella nelsoni]